METNGTITIICNETRCTMLNKYNSGHAGLGLKLVRELREIIPHLQHWINLWKTINIITKDTDPESPHAYNIYPGSLHAVAESALLIHSNWNDSVFDYIIDFNKQTFTCNDERFLFEDLDDAQKYFELEMELLL